LSAVTPRVLHQHYPPTLPTRRASDQRRALGTVPTQQRVVLERFFDESGGMQLVVHAPFGSKINRAWGLALRKKFCVGFGTTRCRSGEHTSELQSPDHIGLCILFCIDK